MLTKRHQHILRYITDAGHRLLPKSLTYAEHPCYGLEYNKINPTRRVTKRIWSVDIARTPGVVKDWDETVNILGQCELINKYGAFTNYRASKAHGRRS
jgi:hypothetical protein